MKPSQVAAPQVTRRGFPLIELLVVIASIAIRAAMLLPALTNAKQIAWTAACRSNEKMLILAWMMYADDSHGRIARAHDLGRNEFDCVGPKQTAAGVATGALGSIEAEKRGFKDGLLWPYIQAAGSHHCPGDRRDTLDNTRKVNTGKADRSDAVPCSMNGPPYSPKPVLKTGQIFSPVTKYMFLEEDTWLDPRTIQYGEGPGFRHGDPGESRPEIHAARLRAIGRQAVNNERWHPGSLPDSGRDRSHAPNVPVDVQLGAGALVMGEC